MERMVARSQYSGLCETCDRERDCTLKRSSRLEIIHCEEFSTQPKTPGHAKAAVPERPDIAAGRAERPALQDPIQPGQS